MLTIAYLTWKEALRRRAPVISLIVAALLLVGAFIPLAGRLLLLPRPEANRIFASVFVFFSIDIVKFFASVFAIALASGSISAELERGVLSSILPKPITRFSVYAGKWLGLYLFSAANVVFWVLVIFAVATYRAPQASHTSLFDALPYLLLYPAVFTTIALLFSTFASYPLAAGLSILAAGVGWSEGVFYVLNELFDIEMLTSASKVAGYLFPLGRMARWVDEGLGPMPTFGGREIGQRSPFRELTAEPSDLVYIGAYVLVAFVVGSIVFGRRNV